MKPVILIAATMLMFTACKKPVTELPMPASMLYTDLHDMVLGYQQYKAIDLDKDNQDDFYFNTLLVGDAVLKRDRLQFYCHSKIGTHLLVNNDEQMPVLRHGEKISLTGHPGYTWYELSAIIMAEKITEENGFIHWEGQWKDASKFYVPVQIIKNNQSFAGWICVSFNQSAEKVILHNAAVSTQPGKDIRAGS